MRLDNAYANASHIPDGSQYPDLWAEQARDFRLIEQTCGRARLNQPVGNGFSYDIFQPTARPNGTMVFVHGGYWKAFDRKDWSHLGQGVMAHGWACAVPSYPLAPDATIPEITQAVRQAIEAIADQTDGPISLAGHSAGGQLVARMAMGDVGLRTDVAQRLHAIAPISPVGDLTDLRETSMWAELNLTDATARSESPTLGKPALDTPTKVWVGAAERPKFLEQAAALADAWDLQCCIRPDRHHFDIVEDLCDPKSDMTSFLAGGDA